MGEDHASLVVDDAGRAAEPVSPRQTGYARRDGLGRPTAHGAAVHGIGRDLASLSSASATPRSRASHCPGAASRLPSSGDSIRRSRALRWRSTAHVFVLRRPAADNLRGARPVHRLRRRQAPPPPFAGLPLSISRVPSLRPGADSRLSRKRNLVCGIWGPDHKITPFARTRPCVFRGGVDSAHRHVKGIALPRSHLRERGGVSGKAYVWHACRHSSPLYVSLRHRGRNGSL